MPNLTISPDTTRNHRLFGLAEDIRALNTHDRTILDSVWEMCREQEKLLEDLDVEPQLEWYWTAVSESCPTALMALDEHGRLADFYEAVCDAGLLDVRADWHLEDLEELADEHRPELLCFWALLAIASEGLIWAEDTSALSYGWQTFLVAAY